MGKTSSPISAWKTSSPISAWKIPCNFNLAAAVEVKSPLFEDRILVMPRHDRSIRPSTQQSCAWSSVRRVVTRHKQGCNGNKLKPIHQFRHMHLLRCNNKPTLLHMHINILMIMVNFILHAILTATIKFVRANGTRILRKNSCVSQGNLWDLRP